MTKTTTIITVGVLALSSLAGCRQDKPHLAGEIEREPAAPAAKAEATAPFFEDEAVVRSAERILSAQRANGAAADGMLYAAHFDGGELNSLGETKIERILAGTSVRQPVRVWIDTPQGELSRAREEAVVAYLKDRGLDDGQIRVATGFNESTRRLASLSAASAYETRDGRITAAAPKLDLNGADAGQGTDASDSLVPNRMGE